MTNEAGASDGGHVISRGQGSESLADAIKQLKARILAGGDKPHVSVDRQLKVVDELSQFPFGRFLLQNRGWNGCWTDYVRNQGVSTESRGQNHLIFNRLGSIVQNNRI